jgi:hypothetical protein
MRVLYERCAAIDVGNAVVAVAVRLPGDGPDGRVTHKRVFKTFYGVLREAAAGRDCGTALFRGAGASGGGPAGGAAVTVPFRALASLRSRPVELKPARCEASLGSVWPSTLWMEFRAWRSQPARFITGTCVAGSLDR